MTKTVFWTMAVMANIVVSIGVHERDIGTTAFASLLLAVFVAKAATSKEGS